MLFQPYRLTDFFVLGTAHLILVFECNWIIVSPGQWFAFLFNNILNLAEYFRGRSAQITGVAFPASQAGCIKEF